MKRLLLVVMFVGLAACSKEAPSMKNDMMVPVGKGGASDDSLKPVPRPTPVVGKGGIPDDSIKPVVVQKPAVPSLGGVPDDSVKPVPKK